MLDATRIAQVIGNLLHNASKYTAPGGEICIELGARGGQANIRVTDPGVGIPASQLGRVFDMFAKIDRAVPDANGGLGIGLALSRQIAQLHAGSLVAQSGGEGHGAAFTLSLPLVPASEGAVAPDPAPAPASSRAMSVVVIEDNEDAAELLAMCLTQLGHHVRVGRSGPEGLALVSEAAPHVVFCDVGLPGMSGIDVCKHVRALQLALQPVMVALTGWGMTDDRRKTREAGFDHHLVKPATIDSLLAILSGQAPSQR